MASSPKKTELPPLFLYMEAGDYDRAIERLRKHPRDVKSWATLRTKSSDAEGGSKISSSKRLPLHHACFKLRTSASSSPTAKSSDDPFVEVCRFILMLIRLYPEAAGKRETRHGCLPLHLACFAACAPRANDDYVEETIVGAATTPPLKPAIVTKRSASDATTATSDTNMSAVHAEETYTGNMGDKITRRANTNERPNVSVSMRHDISINAKREEMAVQVINALLDAYPKGIRVDSEGGRLPLHTACAGRATPRIIQTLVTAHPAAARHRNTDGYLPLHLAAHWGVSHPSVAVTLLKAYPDATLGRNRWERTPLEEALCMAGENGRPHQAALVRALRKHPTYWQNANADIFGFGALVPSASARRLVDVDESLPSNEEEEEKEQQARLKQELQPPSPTARHLSPRILMRKSRSNSKLKDEAVGVNLATMIERRHWDSVVSRVLSNPIEAEQELGVTTRGGFIASTGMTPLHYACERHPPVEVVTILIEAFPVAVMTRAMPGGTLPLHVACTWHASAEVVQALLSADQGAVQVKDELGNIPLHSACFSGAEVGVVDALIAAYTTSVLSRNRQGSRPVDICKRLRHENRKSVMAILTIKKEELMAKHRRSKSSGTWSEIAREAEELNQRHGTPASNDYRSGDDLQEEVGVEVPYEGPSKESQELVWI